MRMQIKATSFLVNARRGSVHVAFGGMHQGEVVTLNLRFPTPAGAELTTAKLQDAAWLRAQQILRCATLVPQPVRSVETSEPATALSSAPIRIQLTTPASMPFDVLPDVVKEPPISGSL